MLSPLRNRFGIPGVISVVALVFAMLGGAYAASQDNGKAAASAKAKRGPKGPKGATGPAGPAGAQGPAGANGKDGANGSNGATGTNGAAGTSVTVNTVGAGGEEGKCVGVGGSKFVVGASKAYACNGAEGPAGNTGNAGPPGPQGDPWTAGGTLPVGSTETGAWRAVIPASEATFAPISFAIPLAAALPGLLPPGNNHTLIITGTSSAEEKEHCDNGAGEAASVTNPEADSGYLCVFPYLAGATAVVINKISTGFGADTAGAMVSLTGLPNDVGQGTFAVTG